MQSDKNKSSSKLWARPQHKICFGIPLGGLLMFILGIIFWGGFNTIMEVTNMEEFCVACHEMRDNVYAEYKTTSHYKNRTGVRASCADCHVPKNWIHKVVRKVTATNELLHSMIGTIDTKEKFEKRRLIMAEMVWQTMRQNNSRECRNCHDYDSMDRAKQGRSGRKNHIRAVNVSKGKTCIDCHQGIVHTLPDEY